MKRGGFQVGRVNPVVSAAGKTYNWFFPGGGQATLYMRKKGIQCKDHFQMDADSSKDPGMGMLIIEGSIRAKFVHPKGEKILVLDDGDLVPKGRDVLNVYIEEILEDAVWVVYRVNFLSKN